MIQVNVWLYDNELVDFFFNYECPDLDLMSTKIAFPILLAAGCRLNIDTERRFKLSCALRWCVRNVTY